MKAQAAIELIAIAAGCGYLEGSARRPRWARGPAGPAPAPTITPSQTTKRRISVFKNMIVYRIAPGWQADLVQVEEALAHLQKRIAEV